ncbi:MAG TPA: hypothetical protein VN905_14100 [Candidatus Binatia bacterium]|nr:hypothetical protein [Candidatus Binatia bacterium]
MNYNVIIRGLALAAAVSLLPAMASAQDRPWNHESSLSGTVSSFGGFNMSLEDGRPVYLHQGTIINPTGTTLGPGMNVVVYGTRNRDGSINADEIDVHGYRSGYNRGYDDQRDRHRDRDDRYY